MTSRIHSSTHSPRREKKSEKFLAELKIDSLEKRVEGYSNNLLQPYVEHRLQEQILKYRP